MQEVVRINAVLSVPMSEVSFHFSRSGGPGGQHVNRTESRVELRFNVALSPSLSDDQRARLVNKLANQIDGDGVLHLFADTYRSQFQNRQAAIRRFQQLLKKALRPEKTRRPTKPTKAAKERRLQQKKHQGQKKRLRKKPRLDD